MKNLKQPTQLFTLLIGFLFMSTSIFAQTTWKVDPAHAKVPSQLCTILFRM